MPTLIIPTAEDIASFGKAPAERRSSLAITAREARTLKPIRKGRATESTDLVGHTLMLNTAVIPKFQCGGYVLGPMRPFAVVGPDAQQAHLRRALNDGRLVDISGTDKAKGIRARGGQTTAVESQDTGKRVFMGQDGRGNTYIVTAKNKTEQKRLEREIKKTGTIRGLQYERAQEVTEMSGVASSPITVEPLEPTKKTKKRSHARTASRKRSARR